MINDCLPLLHELHVRIAVAQSSDKLCFDERKCRCIPFTSSSVINHNTALQTRSAAKGDHTLHLLSYVLHRVSTCHNEPCDL